MSHPIQTIEATVHLGAEHASFAVQPTSTESTIKLESLDKLHLAPDPNIDYLLIFEGKTLENESETLEQLLGGHLRSQVTFHIKKRPKGGA